MAADDSAKSARELLEIEARREHAEMCPQFRFEWRSENPHSRTATLAIELVGPTLLQRLDSIVVRFGNDGMDRGTPDNVFGPVRFAPGIDNAPNRTESAAKPIAKGETVLLQVERTTPHNTGWDDRSWGRDFWSQPVRLRITCSLTGYEPWLIPHDVESPNLTRIEETLG